MYWIFARVVLVADEVSFDVYNLLNYILSFIAVLSRSSEIFPKRVNMMTSVSRSRRKAFSVKIMSIFFQKLRVMNQILILLYTPLIFMIF